MHRRYAVVLPDSGNSLSSRFPLLSPFAISATRLQLTVIIVNYNVCHFLAHCLANVYRATEGLTAEVWVVDNGSTDGSEGFVRKRFPQVKWMNRPDNPGFAVANNLALRQAAGEYVLFLNPDTLLGEDILRQALTLYRENSIPGLLGLRMIDGSGRFLPESKRALPTPGVSFRKMTGLGRLFPRSTFFNRYALGHLPPDQPAPVEVLAGAFMMGPKDLLRRLGGFDEDFWMYGEDIDLSYRAVKATGKPCYYAGQLPIIHFKGESTHKQGDRYVKAFYEAMHLFVRKHFAGQGGGWLNAGLHLSINAGRLLRLLKKPSTPRTMEPEHWWVVGEGEEFRRLFPGLPHTLTDITGLADLRKGSAVLWCISDQLSYEQAIAFMAAHTHLSLRYFWFHPQAGSLIGSDGKDGLGWWREASA